jgi:hypothetical protein
VLAAVYPPDVYTASYFFSEIVFVPCLGFGLWLLLRSARTRSRVAAVGAGLLLGYATLCRPFGLLLLPLLFAYLWGRPLRPRGWKGAVLYAAGFLAAVVPWTVRNYQVHHKFVLVATNGGSTFYGANNDVVAGTPWKYGAWVATNVLPGRDVIEAQPDEVAHDKKEWEYGVAWVKEHPGKFVVLGAFKVIRTWLPFVHWLTLKVYPVANVLLVTPFLALITAGLVRTLATREGRARYAVLHLTMLATLVMLVVFWGEPRFRDANMPALMVYAALGGEWLLGRLRRRPAGPVAG